MLSIDKESVRAAITAIKEKLANPEKKTECIAEIEQLIDMKQSNVWRADSMAPCCGDICGFASLFETEIGILKGALSAVKEGDNNKARTLLQDYLVFLEENYEDESSMIKGFELGNS